MCSTSRVVFRAGLVLSCALFLTLFAPTDSVPAAKAGDDDDDPIFLRGDVDGNGVVNAITDTMFLLEFGLTAGDEPPCLDAADVNDDGRVHPLLDAIRLITWGWDDGPTPPSPGVEDCGRDRTNDDVDCAIEPDCT